MLTKASFEAAVGRAALISHKKNGNKWDALMHLLSKEGLRGYGAVASDFHNLRLRAAQLMAERWFPGFDKRAHPDTGLFVLKGDKELSFGERKMLDTARNLLIKELSLAKGVNEDDIETDLKQIFNC